MDPKTTLLEVILTWRRSTRGTHVFGYEDDNGREWQYYFPKSAFRNRDVEGMRITMTLQAVTDTTAGS